MEHRNSISSTTSSEGYFAQPTAMPANNTGSSVSAFGISFSNPNSSNSSTPATPGFGTRKLPSASFSSQEVPAPLKSITSPGSVTQTTPQIGQHALI
ncbi:unnamed protein product [Ambrosiozyma monospora]|uniref:Unnamed protein product n=1 Tax=Ambrosiozyma monospora TaxID=43982 RepID=A0ACB5UCG4_AMBMO|nr:unnamed protein product [Ambrosiozyma monospora]